MPNSDTLPISTSDLSELSGIEVRQLNRLVRTGKIAPLTKLAGKTGSYIFDPDAPDVKQLIQQVRS